MEKTIHTRGKPTNLKQKTLSATETQARGPRNGKGISEVKDWCYDLTDDDGGSLYPARLECTVRWADDKTETFEVTEKRLRRRLLAMALAYGRVVA